MYTEEEMPVSKQDEWAGWEEHMIFDVIFWR